ncbi:TIGR00341 family protein [Nocardioides sp. GY 10113]|uniref:TIGR00341 family protein n=1 Tax=Nocardioides sp. GY 10113 TaxID=2569761 RepID=UPI0010A8D784|nr:TIGR00341 family protein [Nocardioides sp. GY 10113]TIC88541.1 TIGR00341 family protein [Nocardioides sp. GY 10113]
MAYQIRGILLPENQRRTLEELTDDLDLRAGDVRAKRSAFWTMLTLSAVIASAGVLGESTATVIGAMIIAPLATPIMGIALAIAKRESNRAGRYVLTGSLLVVVIGVVFSQVLPVGYVLLDNPQISSRVSPGVLDMVAALATGLAGAVALARRDVAAVLPGVAIAISLVPPLAVVGICLGSGDWGLALGATLLFVSNLLALVLAGATVFAVLGYADEATRSRGQSRRRAYAVLTGLMVAVLVPLLANTFLNYVFANYTRTAKEVAQEWIADIPGAEVTDVSAEGLVLVVSVKAPGELPPIDDLRAALDDRLLDVFGVRLESTVGTKTEVRPSGG